MINLDDFYSSPKISFSTEETKWIKSRDWYKENKSISECLNSSEERVDLNRQIISLSNKLLDLYDDSHVVERKKAIKEIDESESDILRRRKLHKWFDLHDKNLKIQEII
jgi:hypothetical protein